MAFKTAGERQLDKVRKLLGDKFNPDAEYRIVKAGSVLHDNSLELGFVELTNVDNPFKEDLRLLAKSPEPPSSESNVNVHAGQNKPQRNGPLGQFFGGTK